MTIVANLIFIPPYGISGAAIATGTSLFFMNFSRFIVLKWKYNLNPFSYRTLLVLVLALGSYGISTFVPQLENVWLDLIVRSAVICAVFIPLTIALKLSVDGNKFLQEIVQKVRK